MKYGSLKCNYKNVERWTQRLDPGVAHHRLVLFPTNVSGEHWILIVVHTHVTNTQVIHDTRVYDSFNAGQIYSHPKAIKHFFKQEYKAV